MIINWTGMSTPANLTCTVFLKVPMPAALYWTAIVSVFPARLHLPVCAEWCSRSRPSRFR